MMEMEEVPLVMHGNHCPLCGKQLLFTFDWGWSRVCLCGFNEFDIFIKEIETPASPDVDVALPAATPLARAA